MSRTTLTYFIQKVEDKPPTIEAGSETQEFWNDAAPGRYTVKITKERKAKSKKQLGAIFGHEFNSIIAQANEKAIDVSDLLVFLIDGNIPKGQGITPDFLHELMYVICPTTNKEGRRVTLSKMDTVQATALFKGLQTILAPLGIDVSDPDPNWAKKKRQVLRELKHE